MRYAVARFHTQQEELGYRFYITELVRLYVQGKTFGMSYLEWREPRPSDDRTAEQIVSDVTSAIGIPMEG